MQPVRSENFRHFQLRHAHVRKDTRLCTLFHIASDKKLGGAWEQGYEIPLSAYRRHCKWEGPGKYNENDTTPSQIPTHKIREFSVQECIRTGSLSRVCNSVNLKPVGIIEPLLKTYVQLQVDISHCC